MRQTPQVQDPTVSRHRSRIPQNLHDFSMTSRLIEDAPITLYRESRQKSECQKNKMKFDNTRIENCFRLHVISLWCDKYDVRQIITHTCLKDRQAAVFGIPSFITSYKALLHQCSVFYKPILSKQMHHKLTTLSCSLICPFRSLTFFERTIRKELISMHYSNCISPEHCQSMLWSYRCFYRSLQF